jgi:hypothetical protein
MGTLRDKSSSKPIASSNVAIIEKSNRGYTNYKGSFTDGGYTYALEVSVVDKHIENRKGETITHFIKVAKFKSISRK